MFFSWFIWNIMNAPASLLSSPLTQFPHANKVLALLCAEWLAAQRIEVADFCTT